MGSVCGRVGPGGGVRGFVLCCPFGTAMGWPSRAGPRAGLSPLRERAAPPPGRSRRAARCTASRASWARAGSSSQVDVTGPGGAGPGPGLQVKRTSRAPVAPGPDQLSESSGCRGRRRFGPDELSFTAAGRGADALGPRLAAPHGRRADGARGPAGRCAAGSGVTWRPRGPAGDRVLTVGSTPGAVTASWGTKGDAEPPRASAPWLHGGPPLLPPSCLADSGSTGVVE